MTYLNSILLFTGILIFQSCNSDGSGPTDLKEYGFQGQVESVSSKRYVNMNETLGEWDYTDGELVSENIYHFNKDGNIDNVKNYFYMEDEKILSEIEFTFKNGFKHRGKYVGDNKGLMGDMEFTWEGNRKYYWQTPDINGSYSENISELDEKFRDEKGTFNMYEENRLVYSETYINYFNDDNQIIKSRMVNPTESTTNTVMYEDLVLDDMGNIIEMTLVDSATGLLQQHTIREFTYYK